MQDTKIFIIRLDGRDIAQIPIRINTTVGDIKEYFKEYLQQRGKNPNNYTVKIYKDRINKFDVDDTDQYDAVAMSNVWSQLTQPFIVLDYSPNYFSRLYTDAIYQIALRVSIKDLASLCLADKRLSQICQNEKFWTARTIQDFGIVDKREDMSWKELYQVLSDPNPNKLLLKAAKEGNLRLVEIAYNIGANLNVLDKSEKFTALSLAIIYGHLDVVKYLVEQGANIALYGKNTDLDLAAAYGHLAIVKYLVDYGINSPARLGQALLIAAKNGHLNIVKYLVENGANINIYGGGPLQMAGENGHLEIVKYLVEQGSSPLDEYYLRRIRRKGHEDVIQYLESINQ